MPSLRKPRGTRPPTVFKCLGCHRGDEGGQLILGPKGQKEEQEVDADGWSALAPYE